ncbi:MAG: alpha-L-fucosidase [Ignavibacteriales bacterium]|nr:alpha-L-fucosidase [Ignavibacteriales bacterium]
MHFQGMTLNIPNVINRKLIYCIVAIVLSLHASAQTDRVIKIACIGNSITYGAGIQDRERNSYPAQLQQMFGKRWEVRNFGLNGRTLLKKGDYPYWNERELIEVKEFNPNVVIIMLGTNDTKPWNWKYKNEFVSDYEKFIDEFQKIESHPLIYICIPVPAFPGDWGIRDSIIRVDIIPSIKQIQREKNVSLIDLYTPFTGKSELFPDEVHPNQDGARLIAREIYNILYQDYHLIKSPPAIYPIPTVRQLEWQNLEYYCFLHFTTNTFTDKEWGYGDEPESIFNPVEFDAEQIVRVVKDAGMKGLIITAKHHDGFCLWQSKYTEHSVKNSLWRDGKGDVVEDLSDACKKYGLKFGVYLSPWDRNHRDYGKSEYLEYYRNQLRELLTNYGEIFEVWFDGANGGDGYYGGEHGTRMIDRKTYYDWKETWKIVRELQPNAVMFSDVGPDIRWVGNENGYAGETCWSLYGPAGKQNDEPAPGYTKYKEAIEGHRDGKLWLPAECDVSIRPGWFYHEREDTLVKSAKKLFDLYLQSVGRNGSLLLNIPPDRRGRFNKKDIKVLMEFKKLRDAAFASNLAKGANVTASNYRYNDIHFSPDNVLDDDKNSYWATDDSVISASLLIDFKRQITVESVLLQEYIALGQRIESFIVDGWDGKAWKILSSGTTIGHKRILAFSEYKVSKIRLNIIKSKSSPVISNVEVY